MDEPETGQLRRALSGRADVISSLISRIEVARALNRATAGNRPTTRQFRVLRDRAPSVGLLPLEDQVVQLAESIEPPNVRSFDAIRLATALSVGALEALGTHDDRLPQASIANRLTLLSPGR